MSLPVRLAQRAGLLRADSKTSAVQVTAPVDSSPETIIAMAEGAQQAHDVDVEVDVLIPATDRQANRLADIIDAVEPHAEQALSVDLLGASAHERNAVICMHFKASEEDE